MLGFLILHYMVAEETIGCVRSVKEAVPGPKRIVIVDNASPNGSGTLLAEHFAGDGEVTVLLHEKNDGFAGGNNFGYRYIRENEDVDYLVVMNNDAEIAVPALEEKLDAAYRRRPFGVLGPDIYSTTFAAHQSPKRLRHYTLREVEELHASYEKALQGGWKIRLRALVKQSFFLRRLKYQRSRRHIDPGRRYENVPLHGACLIFSRRFMRDHEQLFHPGTFFYYETEILDSICFHEKIRTVYEPSILVLHHQNAATDTVYRDMYQKTMFANQNNAVSTAVFADVLRKQEAEKAADE